MRLSAHVTPRVPKQLIYLMIVSCLFIVPTSVQCGEPSVISQIGHSEKIEDVALSPTGSRAASISSDKTIKLWHVESGRVIKTLQTSEDMKSIMFSQDGHSLLAGGLTSTNIWDVNSGQKVRSFQDGGTPIEFSPNGRLILSKYQNRAYVWDIRSTKPPVNLVGHTDEVLAATFSRDGKAIITVGADNTVKIWNPQSGSMIKNYSNFENTFEVVDIFSGANSLVNATEKSVQIIDIASGKITGTIMPEVPSGPMVWEEPFLPRKLSLSPDETKIVVASTNWLRVFDIAKERELKPLEGHSDTVTSFEFSRDGSSILSGSEDKTLKLWSVQLGGAAKTFQGYSESIFATKFSPNEQYVASAMGKTILLWSTETGQLVRTFAGHTDNVLTLSLSPDVKSILSGGRDHQIIIWDVNDEDESRKLSAHEEPVTSVSFSPNGDHFLSVADDATLRVWATKSGKPIKKLIGLSEHDNQAKFTNDGRTIIASSGDRLWVWDYLTNDEPRIIYGKLNSFDVSSDKSVIVGGGYRDLFIWQDSKLNKFLGSQSEPTNGYLKEFTDVKLSPEGNRLIAATNSGLIEYWDVGGQKKIGLFQGHRSRVSAISFSKNGEKLLSAGADGTTRLWDVESRKELVRFVASVPGVAPDGLSTPTYKFNIKNRQTLNSLPAVAASSDDDAIEWISMTPEGFFASSLDGEHILAVLNELSVLKIEQLHQSLYNPDLVRAKLAGDPEEEYREAAETLNLAQVLESGDPPRCRLKSADQDGKSSDAFIFQADIESLGGGVGRIEWKLNGVTVGVESPQDYDTQVLTVSRKIFLEKGPNIIGCVAYNKRNILASRATRVLVDHESIVSVSKPNLYVLAIGVNNYIDTGGASPYRFFPLNLAVSDALAVTKEFEKAGAGLYEKVVSVTLVDEEASLKNLEKEIEKLAGKISEKDTFVFFAAAHGYSHRGRFYLIPQDYEGGLNISALKSRAVDQFKLQHWFANVIKAKKMLVLFDTCESGALTAGHTRSRFLDSKSEAAIGRLHESTGRPILTAAAMGQDALEFTDLGHGVFTSAIIDSLFKGDSDRNGNISVRELAAHVQAIVPELVKNDKLRASLVRRGVNNRNQSARFGSRAEDFDLFRRLD